VPKKRHRRRPSSQPKKPEVTPGVAPVASEKPMPSPLAATVASAILKKPDRVEEDAMTGVEPSVSADPPPPAPLHATHPLQVSEGIFLQVVPFPREFDRAKITGWIKKLRYRNVVVKDFGAIVRAAGHTDPRRLQYIQELVMSLGGLPSSPSLPTTHSLPLSR
jgi:hypothetical protein